MRVPPSAGSCKSKHTRKPQNKRRRRENLKRKLPQREEKLRVCRDAVEDAPHMSANVNISINICEPQLPVT